MAPLYLRLVFCSRQTLLRFVSALVLAGLVNILQEKLRKQSEISIILFTDHCPLAIFICEYSTIKKEKLPKLPWQLISSTDIPLDR
jgi:hypothetical protein